MSKPTLSQPVEIAKFWKNRKGEAIVVRLSEYEGHILIDQRTWFTAQDGTLKPGKGLACSVRHLPELVTGLNKALAKARELGLIDRDDSDGEAAR
jgi:hypothetical protein